MILLGTDMVEQHVRTNIIKNRGVSADASHRLTFLESWGVRWIFKVIGYKMGPSLRSL